MAITEQFTVKVQVSEMVKKEDNHRHCKMGIALKFEYYNQIHCFKGTAFQNSYTNAKQCKMYGNLFV